MYTLPFVVNQIFAKNVMHSSYFWPHTNLLGTSFVKCNKLLSCLYPAAMWQKRSHTAFRLALINWRGVWNKALSDFWCNVKFSSSFTSEFKEIWKENVVIYQKSLKAFLQAPLQLLSYFRVPSFIWEFITLSSIHDICMVTKSM